MSATLSKYLLATIFIVGQLFASDLMRCSNPHESTSFTLEQGEHAGHDMSAMAMDQSITPAMDCCDEDCSCPVGTCASPVLLSAEAPKFATSANPKVFFILASLVKAPQHSLIKPPINA